MPASPTPRLKLPLPAETDPADVPADLLKLATPLDTSTVIFGQGGQSAQPAAGTAGRLFYQTDRDMVSYDNGTAWRTLRPPLVTALPASPVDGDEVLLLVAPVIWHLRYYAAAPTSHKWLFVGGAAYDMQTNTPETRGPVAAAGTYYNLNSPPLNVISGTAFTAPVAGNYLCHFGMTVQLQGATAVNVGCNVVNRTGPAIIGNQGGPATLSAASQLSGVGADALAQDIAAGVIFSIAFSHTNTTATVIYSNKYLSVLPIALG